MLRTASIAILITIAILLSGGCERKAPTDKAKDATPQAATEQKHGPDDGHADHDHGEAGHDDHAGHDHGEANHDDHADHDHGEADHDGHGHGGPRHELGSNEIAGLTVKVVQFGTATSNIAELIFELDIRGEPAPTAVRLLVRAADGSESLKIKAGKGGNSKYDAHVGELPNKLGESSVLVVELETPSGTKELTFPLKT